MSLPEKPAELNQNRDPVEGWDKVPLFMKSLPPEDDDLEGNKTINALQSLMYDDDPEDTAAGLRTQANEYFKGRRFREAMSFYTQALTEVGPSLKLESKRTLWNNRAACQLELHNYASCLRDCSFVIASMHPDGEKPSSESLTSTRKALFRSSKALRQLGRWDDATDTIARLKNINKSIDVEDPALEKLSKEVEKLKGDEKRRKEEKDAREKKEQLERNLMENAFISRGYYTTKPFSLSKCPPEVPPPSFDPDDQGLIIPVFLLQPKASPPTRDLILQFHEDTTFDQQLEPMGFSDKSNLIYAITKNNRILKVGRKLTLKKILEALAVKDDEDGKLKDGVVLKDNWCAEFVMVPKGKLEQEWITEQKEHS